MKLTLLEKRLLAYCIEDYMGLWVVVGKVYGTGYNYKKELPIWVREKTMEVLLKLLSQKLIIIGTMIKGRFEPFSDSNDCILKKIEKEWDDLGRPPNIGDTFWIIASEKGEQLAKELGLQT
ncbi:MAG: hypothetical protein RBT34_13400 [Anaerolineaceae bacterium]|jgi:hypothetical protein|nr:hypothetical protein [Anaerolineaceae bacterium]